MLQTFTSAISKDEHMAIAYFQRGCVLAKANRCVTLPDSLTIVKTRVPKYNGFLEILYHYRSVLYLNIKFKENRRKPAILYLGHYRDGIHSIRTVIINLIHFSSDYEMRYQILRNARSGFVARRSSTTASWDSSTNSTCAR